MRIRDREFRDRMRRRVPLIVKEAAVFMPYPTIRSARLAVVLISTATTSCNLGDAALSAAEADLDSGDSFERGSEASDAGNEPDSISVVQPSCSELQVNCAPDAAASWPILLTASQFGSGIRLIALSFIQDGLGYSVLGEESTDAGAKPVVIMVTDLMKHYAVARVDSEAAQPLTPVSIALSLTPPQSFVMLCDGEQCALSSASPSDPVLRSIEGAEVPSSVKATGIVAARVWMDESYPTDRICAYGDGMSCWNGAGWTTRIEPGSGPVLRAAAVQEDTIIAVGDQGRIVRVNTDNAQDIAAVGVNLRSVIFSLQGYVAGGERGTIVTPQMLMGICEWSTGEDAIIALGLNRDNSVTAFSRDQITWVSGDATRWCVQQGSIQGVIAGGMFQCGNALNTLVLTPDALFGEFDCGCQVC